jgi:hypothetical protein
MSADNGERIFGALFFKKKKERPGTEASPSKTWINKGVKKGDTIYFMNHYLSVCVSRILVNK